MLDRQRAVLLDERREVAAVDELHDEILDVAGLARVVGGDDVRMLEPGGGVHFALEALDGRFVFHRGGRHHLQRDDALHPPMLGLVDLAHAAGADLGEDHVVAHDQPRAATGEQLPWLETR